MGRHLGQGPGFRVTRSVKFTLDVGQRASAGEVVRYFERAADEARRHPGVTSATVTSAMPLFSFSPGAFVPEGYSLPRGTTALQSMINSVDEHYFEAMEIPIVAGRPFRVTDGPGFPAVAIVNQVLADRHWPEGAVGRRFRLNDAEGPLVEVVGVARTTKYGHFVEPPQGMIYFPFRQQPRQLMVLVAASAAPSDRLLGPLSEALSRVDPAVAVQDPQTLEQFFEARATSFSLLAVRLIGSMGIMGVILSTIGLYGLVSYAASRRTREIGIRIAIGATTARIVAMVLHQGMIPAWCGLAAGCVLSVAATKLLPRALPLSVSYDPGLFVLVGLGLLVTTVLAAFIPARRCSQADPTIALRHD
jgi:predicted permease